MDHRKLIKKPRTQQGRETLNRILSAAAEVFYKKGYYGASIVDVAIAADVAPGTIYIYFESKYNLYKFLVLQCGYDIRKYLEQIMGRCSTWKEAELIGMQGYLEYTRQHPYAYCIIGEVLFVDKQLAAELYSEMSSLYIRRIDEAKSKGEIRPEINSEVLAWMLMGAINFLSMNWGLFAENPTTIRRITERVSEILSEGLFVKNSDNKEEDSRMSIRIEVDFDDVVEEAV